MRLVRERDGALLAGELELADRFLSRLRGLMGRRALPEGRGLWLEPCDSIHMMFVPFAIDVIFVLREARKPLGVGARGEVVKVCPGVSPWLGLAWCRGATGAVEVGAGRATALGIQPGDTLKVEAA